MAAFLDSTARELLRQVADEDKHWTAKYYAAKEGSALVLVALGKHADDLCELLQGRVHDAGSHGFIRTTEHAGR